MKSFILKNGLKVIFEKRNTNSVAIELTVKVGSNNETKKVSGISHFIEHMLFEGTTKRPSSLEISTEIEKLGGELNAYTSNERTSFFIKILNKHFKKGLDILSDIIKNPLFKEESIEKERKVILKEVDMVTDEPRFHQWILFQKTLFKKHPAKNPTYGSKEAVKNITKKDIQDYYNKYYLFSNMVLTIVGNVKDVNKSVIKYFNGVKKINNLKKKKIIEPSQTKPIKKIEKRNLFNSYVVLGYKTVPRIKKESYALDIIYSILGRGQSGRLFEEIRNKHGLAYEVGAQHEAGIDYGFFAVYLSTDKKNITKARDIILEEITKLKKITDKEIKGAKLQIEGAYSLENDDNFRYADQLGFWDMVSSAKHTEEYIKKLKKVTKKDIINVIKKYLNKNYCLTVIEQKK